MRMIIKMGKRLDKVFKKEAYALGIRRANTDDPFFIKYPTIHEWWADPFVCSDKGEDYCFVELMSSYRLHGEIAVALIKNGKIGDFRVVISEPFHMSFPNVFLYRNQWYMLPETNACRQVRLYRAVNFPYEWELDTILCTDERLVDHALLPMNDIFFVVSNDILNEAEAYNRFFVLDMEKKSFAEFFPEGEWGIIRPGGTFYKKNDKWRHVLQDGILAYGDFLHLYEVETFHVDCFKEREIGSVHVKDFRYENDNKKLEHIHTFNCNDKYEVIDLQYPKTYPNKLLIHWYHEYLKHVKKNWK